MANLYLPFTPSVDGFWLADCGPRFQNLRFSIIDANYPALGKISVPLESYVSNIRSDLSYYCRRNCTRDIDPRDERLCSDLFLLVTEFRQAVRSKLGLYNFFPQKNGPNFYPYSVSDEMFKKRWFFLYVAGLVVTGKESVESAAKRFKVNRTNVVIWVSILLTYGPNTFFKFPGGFHINTQKSIIEEHLQSRRTRIYTCTRNYIFNINTFNNMRRRVHRA